MRGEALLARRGKVEANKPLIERDMTAFHDRLRGHGVVLPAFGIATAIAAGALRAIPPLFLSAVTANRAIGPQLGFKNFPCLFRLGEFGGGQNRVGYGYLL